MKLDEAEEALDDKPDVADEREEEALDERPEDDGLAAGCRGS